MERNDTVEKSVRDEFAKLRQQHDHIMYCGVVVDAEPARPHGCRRYSLRIDLAIPVEEIVVHHRGPISPSDDDFRAAVREAFEAARKQLCDVASVQEKKHPPAEPPGPEPPPIERPGSDPPPVERPRDTPPPAEPPRKEPPARAAAILVSSYGLFADPADIAARISAFPALPNVAKEVLTQHLQGLAGSSQTALSLHEAYGAVVVLLLWFWISAFVVLLGAELDAEVERQTGNKRAVET
jgi:hypothetical protein